MTPEKHADKLAVLTAATSIYAAGEREPLHVHEEEGQLKWPRAIALVRTQAGVFVLPRSFAIWIPAGEWHGGIYPDPVSELSLYVHRTECRGLPTRSGAVRVTPALAKAIVARAARGRRTPPDWYERDLAVVGLLRRNVADAALRPVPIQLPTASIVHPVLEALIDNPALDRPLAEWAEAIGMSAQYLEPCLSPRDRHVVWSMAQ